MILIATKAKDLRVVVETVEYLGEFKQNLISAIQEHVKTDLSSTVSSVLE